MPAFFKRITLTVVMVLALLPSLAQAQGPGVQPGGILPVGGAGGVSPLASPQSFQWYDGGIQYSQITNCFSIIQGMPYQENGAGAYVGYLADLNAGKPAPNDIYYVHVVVGGLGNSCSGMRAFIDLALPTGTTTAVDGTHAAYCLYDGSPLPAGECPQSFPSSPYNSGAVALYSTDTAHALLWPIPQGHILELQIPVRSSTSLANSQMRANVWMLDGNSSPWLRPQQGIYVFSGVSSPPTISYPSPSTITETATSAHSMAYLYTYGVGGTGYFDLGTSTGYGLIHEAVAIAAGGAAWVAWDDWGPPALTPDTLYHWRFTFTYAGGTILGVDQTFRTLPDGRVTVGNGQAASCTPSALNSAFTGAKSINFDCGSVPITITMSAGRSIAGNLTINGGNKVTLDAGLATNHFDVQAGAALTLTQISLVNGVNNVTCGGALNVATGAKVTLSETRFIDNSAWGQGGAICNWGTTDITGTLFLRNSSSHSHGGAIGNYGSLRITNSKFMSNTAKANGGGIDMGGTVAVTTSTFINNNTGLRGGGINTYGGSLTVIGSSFISNTANLWGGGLANDASTSMVSGSTFSDNFSAWAGGGLETSGPGSLTLINSTISANRAITDGGGIYWYPGVSTGPISILNSTIAGNRAGVQGGNVYVGGIGIYNSGINLKNTIVGSGSSNNCSGTLLSNGNNLEDTNSCGLTSLSDQRNTNPKLGPLQNNGGATWTHALLLGSPAVDAGTNSGCPATDQRGVARPVDGNGDGTAMCDIGAVEAPPSWRAFLPLVVRN